MPVTKGRAAITQLTAGGTSTPLDTSGSYSQTLFMRHGNGVGGLTAVATARVEVHPAYSSLWYELTTVPFGLTAASTDDRVVDLPDDVAGVRVVYTPPTGPTGFTLDAEVGTITAL